MALMLEHAARTDVGQVRSNNEDALFVSPRMIAVADGVGGAAAGEIASRTAINAIEHLDKCLLSEPLAIALERTVRWGNDTIGFLTTCRPALAGMATTLTAVAIDDDCYAIANIGDSRAYLLREGRLHRLTRDDSYVQELIDGGHLDETTARAHPQRSVVTQALDGRPDPRPTLSTQRACAGDRVLVCSDGLSDLVSDRVILSVLEHTDLDGCARELVRLANAAGGRDNVTVALADVVARQDRSLAWA